MDKSELIIDKALQPFKPAAAREVAEELCSTCRNRTCEKTGQCHSFHLLVNAKAWDMASNDQDN